VRRYVQLTMADGRRCGRRNRFHGALFIAGLAFTEPGLIDQAKIGVLLASAIAGTIGVLLLVSNRAPESVTVQPTALEKGEVDGRGD